MLICVLFFYSFSLTSSFLFPIPLTLYMVLIPHLTYLLRLLSCPIPGQFIILTLCYLAPVSLSLSSSYWLLCFHYCIIHHSDPCALWYPGACGWKCVCSAGVMQVCVEQVPQVIITSTGSVCSRVWVCDCDLLKSLLETFNSSLFSHFWLSPIPPSVFWQHFCFITLETHLRIIQPIYTRFDDSGN